MPDNATSLHHSHGAKQIEDFCREVAPDFNIELQETHWTTDSTARRRRHILTLRTSSGPIKLRFSEKEIKDFGGEATVKNVRARIAAELKGKQRDMED